MTIISISGVHGVGKTTAITRICEILKIEQAPHRPVNPFKDEMLSLLFYVLSFASRDQSLKGYGHLLFIDRDSLRDLLVDVWAHRKLGIITDIQEYLVVNACEILLSTRRITDYSILLDDNETNILHKLKNRSIPEGHLELLEYRTDYIQLLIGAFREEFERYSISKGNYNLNFKKVPQFIINVSGKSKDMVVDEIIGHCKEWNIILDKS